MAVPQSGVVAVPVGQLGQCLDSQIADMSRSVKEIMANIRALILDIMLKHAAWCRF